ncbi:uncharacterized protein LOC142345893 isoform X2 [Convolutriloba macropyga]|uniref:uncharacterized protein LOC142345893 isoform X2 n=1 Tax=Convolutriloba macropyga TaxID=536237 RepID=UPI003F5283D6
MAAIATHMFRGQDNFYRFRNRNILYIVAVTVFFTYIVLLLTYSNSEMSEEQQNIVRMRSNQLEQFSYRELEYYISRFRAVRPVTRVLVLVATRPQSSNLRNVIRETWAHRINWCQFYKQGAPVAMYNYPGIVERFNRDQLAVVKFEVKFVTGNCSGYERKNCDAAVELDYRHYRDIVQGNFIEGYFNLSLKTNFILQYGNNYTKTTQIESENWASQWSGSKPTSRNVHFLVKVDDDTFVNMRMLGAVLAQTVSHNAYGGFCGSFDRPKRVRSNKFFVAQDIFPHRFYPAHCQGPLYYLSADLVAKASLISRDYDNLYSSSPDFRIIAKFEDIVVGYYLYLSASVSDKTNSAKLNSVILVESKVFLTPFKHYLNAPYYSLLYLGLEKGPHSSMFMFGDYRLDPLPPGVAKLCRSNSSLHQLVQSWSHLSHQSKSAKISENKATENSTKSTHSNHQEKLSSNLVSHFSKFSKDREEYSRLRKLSISIDEKVDRSVYNDHLLFRKLVRLCISQFIDAEHVVAYHRVNTYAQYSLNFCLLNTNV